MRYPQLLYFFIVTLLVYSPPRSTANDRFQLTYLETIEYRTSTTDAGECTLTFTLSGEQLEDALDAGRWQLDEASDNAGTSLQAKENFTTDFAALAKQTSQDQDQPIATVKLGLTLPERKATTIQTLRGTLGINIYRKQIVIIDSLSENQNQLIENPLFKAHGFTVQVIDPQHAYPGYTRPNEQKAMRSRAVALRIEGDIDKVDSFKLVAPDGSELSSRPAGFGAGRSRVMARMADAPLPAGTTVHLLIPIDPKEVRIPFSFANIPLP